MMQVITPQTPSQTAAFADDSVFSPLLGLSADGQQALIATPDGGQTTVSGKVQAFTQQYRSMFGQPPSSADLAIVTSVVTGAATAAKVSGDAATMSDLTTSSTCKMAIFPSLGICDTYIILGGAAVAVLILLSMGSKKGQG